jgi:surface carbohydrate biosynthesis protein
MFSSAFVKQSQRRMRPIDVLFFIEHVDRELDAATCIVEMLERRFGIAADIRNFYADMHYCLRRYRPAIVVTPFCYFLDHHPMKDYVAAWPNATFFNMAWEQINYKMNQTVKIPKDSFARERVHHVCWTRQYRDVVANGGASPDRLHVTGNPVMKFYDPPYRAYFKSREELAARHGLDPHRKWVLFPENYRWGFLSQAQMQMFIAQDARSEHLIAARDYCVRSLTALFKWLLELERLDDPLVILRPRPATSSGEMAEFMKRAAPQGLPNVRIIKEESAREWILAADHVISSYSTTLIESSLAGKPIHVFSPEPFPEALEDEWYDYVPSLETKQQLLAAIREPPQQSSGARLADWARNTLLPAGDPLQMIAERIAQLHASGLVSRRGSAPDRSRLGPAQIVRERFRNLLQASPYYNEGLRRLDPRYSFTVRKHEKDVFGAHHVAARIERWRAIARQTA